MSLTVTSENNFCRVFMLPKTLPTGFCFDGGELVPIRMVDWFNPVDLSGVSTREVTEDELRGYLIPWLEKKTYMRTNTSYLVLFDFGATITFTYKSRG